MKSKIINLIFIVISILITTHTFAESHLTLKWTIPSGKNKLFFPYCGEGYTAEYRRVEDSTWTSLTLFRPSEITVTPGTYITRVHKGSGTLEGVCFNRSIEGNSYYGEYVDELMNWGDNHWSSSYFTFYYCINMKISATDLPDISGLTNLNSLFSYCTVIDTVPNIKLWDVSHIDTFISTFSYCFKFNDSIGYWDMTNTKVLSYMLSGCDLFDQDVNNWDVSSVTDMSGLFYGCSNFNSSLSNWDVSNVTDMTDLFHNALVFNQSLNHWDVSNVTSMKDMFWDARTFNQPLNNWNVSNVTNMHKMFQNAHEFDQDISMWDVTNVTHFDAMFSYTKLNRNLGSWNLQNIGRFRIQGIFDGTPMSCLNFSNTLIGWAANTNTNVDVVFASYGFTMNEEAADAQQYLIDNKGWSFSYYYLPEIIVAECEAPLNQFIHLFNGHLLDNNAITIQWSLNNHNNQMNASLEKSHNGKDFELLQENLIDNDNIIDYKLQEHNYYRIKIVDQNQQYSYSNTLQINAPVKDNTIHISPNPFTDKININNIKEATTINIYDITGKKIKSSTILSNETISTSDINAGTYYIELYNSKQSLRKTIIKK